MKKFFLLCLLIIGSHFSYAIDKVTIDDKFTPDLIGTHIFTFEDKTGKLELKDVINRPDFVLNNKSIANFQVSESTFWLKFTVYNKNNTKRNFIEVVQPVLEEVNLYSPDSNNVYQVVLAGMKYPFGSRKYINGTNFLFDLNLKPGEEKTYYLQIRGKEQVLAPVRIVDFDSYYSDATSRNIWFGIYCGIILVMFLYNLFVYLSIREKSYVFYVLHTLFVGLTQASLTGFTFKYLWPNNPWFANYSIFLFTALVSIVGVQFLIEFMRLKKTSPRLFYVLKFFQLIYVVYLITSALGYYSGTYRAILPTQSTIALVILGISIYLYKQGYAEAKYYLIGWSSLMLGIIVYVTKDFGLIPYNNFTVYSLLFGSAAEVTLLSFALADKINIYRKDQEYSQEQTMLALQENERIVRGQNVMLEAKVDERTLELQLSNDGLNKAMKELKDAETQLVESEKMASLGQLTAGIAHEINNPINFVTSNVKPLNRDVRILLDAVEAIEQIAGVESSVAEKQKKISAYKEEIDYEYLKEEIDQLLSGIGEGASRTAEIVKGLRIFSRLDEDDLKKANINEGLESTLVITNNLLNNIIKIQKNYADLPLIECYPGKLNQVFLNIISNGIYAIKKRFEEADGGLLTISTSFDDTNVFIKIADNGTGMDENTKKKLFEPFFTTKDVGEGTGLGLSIAYNTINKHNGQIQVNSEIGKGTEFILILPLIQK